MATSISKSIDLSVKIGYDIAVFWTINVSSFADNALDSWESIDNVVVVANIPNTRKALLQ